MKPTQQSYEQLTLHGVKPSVQRLAVMEYLLTHRTHPTVDEIYRALVSKIPTLSQATVYNTLKLFVSHGWIMIFGRNTMTLPTPPITPSTSRSFNAPSGIQASTP